MKPGGGWGPGGSFSTGLNEGKVDVHGCCSAKKRYQLTLKKLVERGRGRKNGGIGKKVH